MHDGATARRRFGTALVVCLLSVSAGPGALASEWDKMLENQRAALRAHEGRIAEIEAKEPGGPADRERRADKITRDRIARIKPLVKGDGESRRLSDAAERASNEPKALADVYEGQDQLLASVTRAWGANGTERRKLGDSVATMEKNLGLIKLNLEKAIEAADATAAGVRESGLFDRIARIESAVGETSERLNARWQREHVAREREREQREREAAERLRGLR